MKKLIYILILVPFVAFSQQSKASLEKEARALVREGNELYAQEKYVDAESAFKKALQKNPNYEIAKYNLGNALIEQGRTKEALEQYEVLAKMTKNDDIKSHLMHNIGNGYYKEKNYQKAIEAYKNSLRANPSDEETRYNLALAQKMLEDQQNQDQNQDENQDNKDQQNQDQDQNQDENQDQQEQDQQQDEQNQDNQDQQQDQNQEQQQDDKQEQQQQPQPGKLSPQQIEQLLEAMNNEEKKTQEKMNAKKERGKKTKQEKDW